MPDRADGFCAVTLATVYQMQRGPFSDKRIKAQRHLGTFALRVAPHAQPLGARVNPLRYVAEPCPRRSRACSIVMLPHTPSGSRTFRRSPDQSIAREGHAWL